MNVLLDTCTILWAAGEPDALSSAAKDVLMDRETRVYVSAISCAEIACLAEADKISVTPHWRTWFDGVMAENQWTVLDIDLDIIQEAFSLPPPFHRDPADRILAATARQYRHRLVTADRKLLDYPHVHTLW